MEESGLEDTMTKTIEEQIKEARAERDAIGKALDMEHYRADSMNALNRLWTRATSRLATLEAVRDGRMIPVYATASVASDASCAAYGHSFDGPDAGDVLDRIQHDDGDALTILRGYAHVPSTQVHEVEADSEVVL